MQTRELREYRARRGWDVAGEYVAPDVLTVSTRNQIAMPVKADRKLSVRDASPTRRQFLSERE
jgi:hypothetical protein